MNMREGGERERERGGEGGQEGGEGGEMKGKRERSTVAVLFAWSTWVEYH